MNLGLVNKVDSRKKTLYAVLLVTPPFLSFSCRDTLFSFLSDNFEVLGIARTVVGLFFDFQK